MYGYEERNIDVDYESKRNYPGNNECRDAFKAGADWADENPINLWHDASEEPQEDGWILLQFITDVYVTLELPRDIDVWHDFIKMHNFARWAYVRDLLPKGGEKC